MIDATRVRRVTRAAAVGVDLGGSLNLVGTVVKYLSLAFLFPTAIAFGYGESPWPFLIPAALSAAAGWALERFTYGRERIGAREGFLVVAVTWLLAAAFVSLPYLLSGEEQLPGPLDAYFEAMSGMTTTGASILTDIEGLPRSLAMWRQFSQWIGGMGIIVLALAVLPRLRVGGRQLLESELPGPEVEKLTARIRAVARRLWLVYVVLTGLQILVLALVGWTGADPAMNLFEAVAHSFATLPTGGFSTKARSIEAFGPATQWAIAAFMLVAGANFALIYRAFRREGRPDRDEEFRLYVVVLALASVALFAKLVGRGIYEGEEAVRHAVFQAASMMTTTGFASVDFNEWPIFAGMVLVGLMLVGGSAGSTAGDEGRPDPRSRKAASPRAGADGAPRSSHPDPLQRLAARRADGSRGRRLRPALCGRLRPRDARPRALRGRQHRSSRPFVARGGLGDGETLGNVGPGLGFLGPMGSFESFSDSSKAIMVVLMWMGRLELLPVVVLFTRGYWRR